MEKDFLFKLQQFQNQLNKKPNPAEIRENPFANNTKYLPISFVEMTLDEMFFGLWQTVNFRTKVVGNEISGEIDLMVFHPVIEQWITRTGAAATMIRQQKGAGITEIEKKIHNALEMDYPHLKADCIVNAARSLGKLFGRDLNRKFEDMYKPLIQQISVDNGAITAQVDSARIESKIKDNLLMMLEQANCPDEKLRDFRIRIEKAADRDFGQIRHEIEMFIPEPDPAKQFKKMDF